MGRIRTYITFWGTFVTATILMWALSQGYAKPEPSQRYIQAEAFPKPVQRIARHIVPKLKSVSIKGLRHLVNDVTIKRLREYAVIESQELIHQPASKEDVNDKGQRPDLKVTPSIGDIINKVRPKQITGIIKVEGKEYEFGSGGRGQSIPYGDYLITPDAVGAWGSKHGAIGVADGTIPDPKLRRDRDGIELHAATNDKLRTDGCVSIKKDQWPEFREQVLAMVRDDKKVYLHVSDQGASVSTDPFEFIGAAVTEPTFHDVLGLIEQPLPKAPEITPSRRCCELMRTKKKHTREVVRTAHFHGHAAKRRRA